MRDLISESLDVVPSSPAVFSVLRRPASHLSALSRGERLTEGIDACDVPHVDLRGDKPIGVEGVGDVALPRSYPWAPRQLEHARRNVVHFDRLSVGAYLAADTADVTLLRLEQEGECFAVPEDACRVITPVSSRLPERTSFSH